jgi:serine/threonine-protein kinase
MPDSPSQTVFTAPLLQRFEACWQRSSEPPDLSAFLAETGPLATGPLLAVVLFDQRTRWIKGCGRPAESYLRQLPNLSSDSEAAVAVVYNEFLLREEAGGNETEDAYVRRFPQLQERLRTQFELHQALANGRPEVGALDETIDRSTAHSTPSELAQSVAGYEIMAVLGRGGMGVVYQARHLALNRIVALKMILAGSHAGPEQRARFRQEAEAVARLQHANIVQIYDVGECEGHSYLALEYVAGGTLAQKAASTPQQPAWAARLIEALARAIHMAHLKGVIHRDLKPTNILLTPEGAAKITDFGLARYMDDDSSLTKTGILLGTPGYMAPEQASGNARHVGPAADIYALGAILYELLTGQPPFRGDTPFQTVDKVLTTEPTPPRRLQPKLPRDVETICMKCLQKRPEQRYATAEALADDLHRFLNDKSITARPVPRAEHVWRWCRRNPWVAGLSAAVFLLVLTVAVGSSIGMIQLRSALNDSEKSNKQKELQRWQTRVEQARANRLSRRPGQRIQTLQILGECVDDARRLKLPPEQLHELRNDFIATLAVNDVDIDQVWNGFPAGSFSLSFDGNLELYARTDNQGHCTVRRVRDDVELWQIAAPSPVCAPQLSPDGRYLALCTDSGGRLEISELAATGPKSLARSDDAVAAFFAPSCRQVAITHTNGVIDILDLPTGERRRRLPATALNHKLAVAWHPKESLLAVFSYFHNDGFEVRDADTGAILAQANAPRVHLAWHPNGHDLVAVEGETGLIKHFEFIEAERKLVVRRQLGAVGGGTFVEVDPSGDYFICLGWDSTLRYYDFQTGQLLFQSPIALMPHTWPQLDKSGERMAGAARIFSGQALILRMAASRERRMFFPAQATWNIRHGYYGADIHPEGRLLVVSTVKGFCLFDLETGRELGLLPQGHGIALFEPSGSLFTSCASGTFRWPVHRDRADPTRYRIGPPQRLPFAHGTHDFARSSDGHFLAKAHATTYGEGAYAGVWLWDCHDPDRPPLRLQKGENMNYVSFSPDGSWLACGDISEHVSLYRLHDSGRVERTTTSLLGQRVRFSPNGRWLWAGSFESGQVFDTNTWQPRFRHEGAAAFSPDSSWLAASTMDGRIRVLHVQTGKELAVLEDPDLDQSAPPVFSPDGSKVIALKHASKGIQVWDLRRIGDYLRELGMADDWPAFPRAPSEPASPISVTIDATMPPRLPIRSRPDCEALEREIALYSASLSLLPVNPELYRRRGEAWLKDDDAERAIADFEMAWLLHPDRPRMNQQLISTCNNQAWDLVAVPSAEADARRALQFARRAVSLAPEEALYVNTLGVAQYRNGQMDGAISTLEKSLKLGRGRFDAFDLYFLAQAHAKRGEADKAREYFEQAVRWQNAQKNLSSTYQKELDSFKAEAERTLAESSSANH